MIINVVYYKRYIVYFLFGGVWMKRVLIGVEDFKELISNNYYVDKSELIN